MLSKTFCFDRRSHKNNQSDIFEDIETFLFFLLLQLIRQHGENIDFKENCKPFYCTNVLKEADIHSRFSTTLTKHLFISKRALIFCTVFSFIFFNTFSVTFPRMQMRNEREPRLSNDYQWKTITTTTTQNIWDTAKIRRQTHRQKR